jgi:sulfur carrier protein ThiS
MDSCRIELRLYASLRKWKEKPIALYELQRPCSVAEFLRENGIPDEGITVFILNGKHARPESPLSDGDTLSIFPLIDGG